MNRISLIISVLVISVFAFTFGSCSINTKTIEPYTIAVDSVACPDTVKIKMNFDIQIFGYVGPSKCYRFDKAYIYPNTSENNELRIEAWGVYSYDGTPCEDAPQWMTEKVTTAIAVPGRYKIRAVRTNYDFAEKTVVAVQ